MSIIDEDFHKSEGDYFSSLNRTADLISISHSSNRSSVSWNNSFNLKDKDDSNDSNMMFSSE